MPLLLQCDIFIPVPRKVLKDQFDASIEPDEPHQIDMDQNQDDLYDEDQFYRESEAIPPAPKLHRELATSDMPTSLSEPSSSVNPPLRSRDSNQLEGMFLSVLSVIFSIKIFSTVIFDIVGVVRFNKIFVVNNHYDESSLMTLFTTLTWFYWKCYGLCESNVFQFRKQKNWNVIG